jgi:DNA mismatch endonuclease (patch repair protein)
MALVCSKNTKPEMLVRRLVHGMGYRYRLHQADLPGKPDLVFRSQRKVVFIHGCFWHGHKCRLGRMPKSRLEYWKPKITGNKERDVRTLRRLRSMRWRALVLWECQLQNLDTVSLLISDKICGVNLSLGDRDATRSTVAGSSRAYWLRGVRLGNPRVSGRTALFQRGGL